VLALQVLKHEGEDGVLEHVGEVPRVIGVPIIHGISMRPSRRPLSMLANRGAVGMRKLVERRDMGLNRTWVLTDQDTAQSTQRARQPCRPNAGAEPTPRAHSTEPNPLGQSTRPIHCAHPLPWPRACAPDQCRSQMSCRLVG